MDLDKGYKMFDEIGRGAYGTVYAVKKLDSNEEYALKRIPMKITDEGIPQSVLREIAVLTSLKKMQHPNITLLHDAFIYRNNEGMFLNVVYERCDWDLHEFLTNIPRNMGDAQCKHFARQIFEGVDFLHTNNIIHRDLKPQNILVNKDQTIKIADFGLSRNYGLHSTFTTIVVTLWYRSPEILLQCRYNTSSDIWAIGCILFEIYTRQPLFPANTEAEQLRTILKKIGTPPWTLWPSEAVVDRSSFSECPPTLAQHLTSHLPLPAVELLMSILKFSSSQRPTAIECLRSQYFQVPT